MSTILYYVSGHGFGHAVRSGQVMGELVKSFGHDVVVRTSAPEWIFPKAFGTIVVENVEVDEGTAQTDSITTDIPGTLARFTGFVTEMDLNAERESKAIARIKPDVIVSDISPLGVAAAKKCGVPVVVIANFLWDRILEGYALSDPRFSELAQRLKEIYEQADAILKTPLSCGMDGYGNITEIPLIARRSAKTREEVRQELSLPIDEKLALLSFGGHGLRSFMNNIEQRLNICDLIGLGEKETLSGKIRLFDRSSVPHEDLLTAADVVIGKLGYGLCSELIATRRPILYTGRNDFAEYGVLNSEIRKYVNVKEISRDKFFNSNLDRFLSGLLDSPAPKAAMRTDGARRAAGLICDYL